jgi:hypothetical protein
VMGFRVVNMTPDGFGGAAFLRRRTPPIDHDLGLFELGRRGWAERGRAVARSGSITWRGRWTRSTRSRRRRSG